MTKLQSKIWDIVLEQKEEALEKKASEIWFNYVNFARARVQLESLRVLSEKEAKELNALCFFSIQKKIRLAVVDENDSRVRTLIDKLKWQWYNVNINLCTQESMDIALKEYDKIRKKSLEKELKVDETKEDLKTSVQKDEDNQDVLESDQSHDVLNDLYKKAISFRASDLHIEPGENWVTIRFRVDWVMQKYREIDHDKYLEIVRIIKASSEMILNVNNISQEWQYYFVINDRKIDLRVSVLPTPHWESIVMRILDSKKSQIDYKDLWFLPVQIEIIEETLEKTNWIILTTWPTWSWKTSTLYSLLSSLNSSEKKTITLEDPIEYHLAWVVQSQIGEWFDFAQWLITCLRQDPDIIMLWEIREKNAARTAMQAAITGHLVLSTVHTNSAIEAIFRLKDLWVEKYLIATSLNLIIWQRLIRKSCPHCNVKKKIKADRIEYIKSLNLNIWIDLSKITEEYFSPWCEKCMNTWFIWREVIWEFVVVDSEIRDMIFKEASLNDFKEYLDKKWFISLQAAAIVKAIKGTISFDEAYRVSVSS